MLEERNVMNQARKEDHNQSSHEASAIGRRGFLQQAMMMASGVAVYSILPPLATR